MSRTNPVTVYLSPEERAVVEQQAASLGMSLSQYMRWRLNTNGSWSMSTSGSNVASGGVTFTWNPPGNTGIQNRDVK